MPCGVFISYQPGEGPWASHVCRSLENQGIPCRIAPREATALDGPPVGPPGSLILILSSSQEPLPRELVRELERVRHSGLELRQVRADQVHTPAGLGDFLHELKQSGTLGDGFSIPSQFLQAVPNRKLLAPGKQAPLAYLPAPKTVSKRRMPALAAAMAGILFVGVWALRASSANLTQYEVAFAQKEAAARQAEAEHEQARQTVEAAERLSSQDRWREADEALSKAIELDHGYAQAYFERGRARFWEREYLAAIEDFDSVIRLDPNLASGATTLRILAQQAQAQPPSAQ